MLEITLPPAPVGKSDPKVVEMLSNMWNKHQNGYDFNAIIRNKKSYRNPSIYSKLIDFFEIEEGGSNFPKDVFEPRAYRLDEKHNFKVYKNLLRKIYARISENLEGKLKK